MPVRELKQIDNFRLLPLQLISINIYYISADYTNLGLYFKRSEYNFTLQALI